MLAPPAAAGFAAAKRKTGSRMLPRTSPTRPPASATRKHQTPTPARTSACTRLNMEDERTDATRERVGSAGSGRGAARAEGPADRPRDGDGRRHCGRPPARRRLRERARLREEEAGDAARARGGARPAAVAARASAQVEANSAADLRVRSVGRARRADEPADRQAR